MHYYSLFTHYYTGVKPAQVNQYFPYKLHLFFFFLHKRFPGCCRAITEIIKQEKSVGYIEPSEVSMRKN